MSDGGFITLHRKFMNHWLYSDARYCHAFLIMLFEVRWSKEPEKKLIKGQFMLCSRGESLKSADTWAKCFGKGWTAKKVRTFFKLLEKDEIISLKTSSKTSHLTISKYETYQSIGKAVGNEEVRQRSSSGQQNNQVNQENQEIVFDIDSFDERYIAFCKSFFECLMKNGKTKKNTNWKTKGWVDNIRLLIEVDGIDYEKEFKPTIFYYMKNITVKFAPHAYSPKSIRDKWIKLRTFYLSKKEESSSNDNLFIGM